MNSKRKIQLADFNRTVILTTANTLFLSRGIESTTMDEIALEAGFREGANKRGNSSRLTQSFHFFMFEPIFSPVNALNQPI